MFTKEEQEDIQRKAGYVWDMIGMDCLDAIASDKGKDINSVTMRRSHVIEVVLDAGRLESEFPKEYKERWEKLSYQQKINLVKSAFPYKSYGT